MTRNLALAFVLGVVIALMVASHVSPDDVARFLKALRTTSQNQPQPSDTHVDRRWRVAQSLLRGEELVSSIHGASLAQSDAAAATSKSEQQGRR